MAVDVAFTVKDGKGKTSRFAINLPTGTSIADAVLFGQEVFPLVQALMNGAVTDVKVHFPVTGLSLTTAGLVSDVEEVGQFVFDTASGFLKRIGIPGFSELKVVDNSAVIDTSDTDVAAFVTAMESGIDLTGAGGSGVISPSDYRDDDLTALDSAVEVFRKS